MNDVADNALFPERFIPEEMHGLIEAEHLARYLWASTLVSGCRVLDAGCGVGYGSVLLRTAGATHVTGVDIAEEAVEAAHKRTKGGVEFIRGDISTIPLDDSSYDVAVCFEAIEHVPDQPAALDELRRVLTPAGLLIISSPNRNVYQEGNPHHTREYTPEQFRAALGARFAHVRLSRQQAWLASMICDDEALGETDPGLSLGVDVRKVGRLTPGEETFALALASDGDLPDPGSLAMITDLDELSSWRERARSAEAHLERSQQDALEAADAHAAAQRSYENALAELKTSQAACGRNERELNRASTILAERNAALRLAAEELTSLLLRTDELESRLNASNAVVTGLIGSASWRLTSPLRALRRALPRS